MARKDLMLRPGEALQSRGGTVGRSCAAPDIAGDRLLQPLGILPVRFIRRRSAMKRLPHRAVALADGQIADAHFPQINVHIEEHRIEHRLGEGRTGLRLAPQALDQQENVQCDDIESPVQRVRSSEFR